MDFVSLNRVVQRRLSIVISPVVLGAMSHKHFYDIKMALKYGVIDWILAIHVDVVHSDALVYQELADARLALPRCVVHRRLLEVVDLARIDAFLDQFRHHFYRRVLVVYQRRREDQVLSEVGLVYDLARLHVVLVQFQVEIRDVACFQGVDDGFGYVARTRQFLHSDFLACVGKHPKDIVNLSLKRHLLLILPSRHILNSSAGFTGLSDTALRQVSVHIRVDLLSGLGLILWLCDLLTHRLTSCHHCVLMGLSRRDDGLRWVLRVRDFSVLLGDVDIRGHVDLHADILCTFRFFRHLFGAHRFAF